MTEIIIEGSSGDTPGGTQEAPRRHPGGTHRRFPPLAYRKRTSFGTPGAPLATAWAPIGNPWSPFGRPGAPLWHALDTRWRPVLPCWKISPNRHQKITLGDRLLGAIWEGSHMQSARACAVQTHILLLCLPLGFRHQQNEIIGLALT